MNYKNWLKKLYYSDDLVHDALSILRSVLWIRITNFYCSRTIRFINEGSLQCKGVCLFGVFSNKMALDYNSKGSFRIAQTGRVMMGDRVRVARGAKIYVKGKLEIGDDTYINPNVLIFANESVKIGSRCAISWNVQIIDDDLHHIIDQSNNSRLTSKKAITIGDHVWIGANVTILKGVTIGDHAVIGANSLVVKDVPAHTAVGGNPAKIIKDKIDWI
jgi:acetyltransferase-like isoleucine patch superfamily enzyme